MASGSKDNKNPELPRGLIDRRGAPTGKAARLPSLRGPRDLTLGGVQRKVFVPNIPVRKEKGREETPKAQTDGKQESRKSRDGSGRGRGNSRGRGSRRTDNLMQMHSIFEDGPTGRAHKGWGSGEGGGGGGGGGDRVSSTPKIKQENTRHGGESSRSLDHLMRDDFVADGPDDDPTLLPVMLPMSAMAKMELKLEKQEKVSVENSQIKDEPMDDTDAVSVASSTEKAISVTSASGRSSPESEDSSETSCKHLLKRVAKSEKEELVFVQLPDVLPGQPATEILPSGPNAKGDADNLRNDGRQGEEDSQKLASHSIADFSEGYVGKLRVRRSGKTELILGNVVLDVAMGTPCAFVQDVVSVRTEEDNPRMTVLGHLQQRMICTPNFESLLSSSLNT